MDIFEHIVNHTLENRYHGNKSKFARELGMDRSNMNKQMKLLHDGKPASGLVKRTLELYACNPCGSEEMLSAYAEQMDESAGTDNECQHGCYVADIRHENEHVVQTTDTCSALMRMIKKLEDFLYELETVLCGKNGGTIIACPRFCQKGIMVTKKNLELCPCKRLRDSCVYLVKILRIPRIPDNQ